MGTAKRGERKHSTQICSSTCTNDSSLTAYFGGRLQRNRKPVVGWQLCVEYWLLFKVNVNYFFIVPVCVQ